MTRAPGTSPSELWRLSASEAARLIERRALGSEELVGACLERIAAREPEIGAWTHLDPEAALARARELDAQASRGLLHGLPVGVKDVIDTAAMPTAYGSPIYDGHRPERDAPCVERLRAAGAVVLGKTVSTELATWTPAGTANPLDPRRTPGGSSSGSAAAVADGMVPLALGSQTAGSTIRPASFCGIVGLKPTHGRLDVSGVKQLSARLDTLGLLARTVADVQLLGAALGGWDATDGATPESAPALAFVRTPWWERAEPDGRRALEDAARRLADAGARVSDRELPPEFAALPEAHDTVMAFDTARSLEHEYREHGEQLSEALRAYIERGMEIAPAAAESAATLARECRARLEAMLGEHDALLTPAVLGEAPLGLGHTGDPLFCRPWTLLGAPAISVPGPVGAAGLPIGVQLVGAPDRDSGLIAAAAWVQDTL